MTATDRAILNAETENAISACLDGDRARALTALAIARGARDRLFEEAEARNWEPLAASEGTYEPDIDRCGRALAAATEVEAWDVATGLLDLVSTAGLYVEDWIPAVVALSAGDAELALANLTLISMCLDTDGGQRFMRALADRTAHMLEATQGPEADVLAAVARREGKASPQSDRPPWPTERAAREAGRALVRMAYRRQPTGMDTIAFDEVATRHAEDVVDDPELRSYVARAGLAALERGGSHAWYVQSYAIVAIAEGRESDVVARIQTIVAKKKSSRYAKPEAIARLERTLQHALATARAHAGSLREG